VPFVSTQPVVNVEDIIIILIVKPFIMRRFARFGQHSAWVVSGLVSKLRVTNMIRFQNVGRKLPKGLEQRVNCYCFRKTIRDTY